MTARAAAIIRNCRPLFPLRPPPALASSSATTSIRTKSAARWRSGLDGALPGDGGLLRARHVRARGRMEISRRPRLPATDRPAISLAQPGLPQLRRFSGHAEFAPPQGDQARAARGDRQRHHHPCAQRQRHHRGSLGCVLCVLHGDRLAQMGPAVSHPIVLLADRRDHGRTTCC